jgi:hypothetical protein
MEVIVSGWATSLRQVPQSGVDDVVVGFED